MSQWHLQKLTVLEKLDFFLVVINGNVLAFCILLAWEGSIRPCRCRVLVVDQNHKHGVPQLGNIDSYLTRVVCLLFYYVDYF